MNERCVAEIKKAHSGIMLKSIPPMVSGLIELQMIAGNEKATLILPTVQILGGENV